MIKNIMTENLVNLKELSLEEFQNLKRGDLIYEQFVKNGQPNQICMKIVDVPSVNGYTSVPVLMLDNLTHNPKQPLQYQVITWVGHKSYFPVDKNTAVSVGRKDIYKYIFEIETRGDPYTPEISFSVGVPHHGSYKITIENQS